MFAGSCVGVICLVILLEFLRRVRREYDLLTQQSHAQPDLSMNNEQYASKPVQASGSDDDAKGTESSSHSNDSNDNNRNNHPILPSTPVLSISSFSLPITFIARPHNRTRHCPSIKQQLLRSGIYTCQFAIAYIVMLPAMYYNGYILICIFIGAFLASLIWGWDLGSAAGGRG